MKLELLAPAKNLEFGKTAINYGADAVYIGAPKFGARAAAGNSLNDIENLINYAHTYYSKVYITLNTILFDNELDEVQKLIKDLYSIGSDAIIIQDMGILEMDIPPIPLFASTQTHNYSLERIKFLETSGFSRIILARELSLIQINEIRKNTKVDLECFVHGAICVSFSGQCYFSYCTTGRSANRGECAQSCRNYYTLTDSNNRVISKNKHLLSTKDLNLSDHLADLIEAGISSFKIEGRLKDNNYLKNVTSFYRKKIDHVLTENLKKSSSGKTDINFIPNPYKSFNRGFTTYFLNREQNQLVNMNSPKSIGEYIGKIKIVKDNFFELDSNVIISNGDGLCFYGANSILNGFYVNKVDKNKVYCNFTSNLSPGLEIYRNFDQDFIRILEKTNSVRKINICIEIEKYEESLSFAVIDEDKNRICISLAPPNALAINKEAMLNSIDKHLRKTGNTIYTVERLVINLKDIPFLSISTINSVKKELLDKLTIERNKNYKKELRIPPIHKYVKYPLDSTYQLNVTNKLAMKFYSRYNSLKIEDGLELQNDFTGKKIMSCKYCIKKELNLCPFEKTINQNEDLKYPLILHDNNHVYKLSFNCKECCMEILY